MKLVALVDQAFVERNFPHEDPIGQGIDIGNGPDGFYEIVGVVGNVRHGGLASKATPTMCVPHRQDGFGSMAFVVRSAGDPTHLSSAVRQVVREIDPTLPAFAITPLADVVSETVAERRFSMLLLGVFAVLALFLAAVGLYGVVAYSVSLRTQEIGVRMAIDAQRGDVLGMIVGEGMKLALIGLAIGLAGAVALSNAIGTMLFNVTPLDPASNLVTTSLLLVVEMAACYVPARRATRVDPIVALRQE